MDVEKYNLTGPQKSIWDTDFFYHDTPVNNIAGCMIVHEKVDLSILKKSILKFIEENDSFRIKFYTDENNEPYQKIFPFSKELEKVETLDFSSIDDVKKYISEIVNIPFNVKDNFLFRFVVFSLPNSNGGFLLTAHHLISDAWTAGLVVNEIFANYENFVNKTISNKSTEFSYVHAIESEESYIKSDKFLKDKEYWNNTLSSLPTPVSFPTSFNTHSISSSAKRKNFILNKNFVKKISDFCANNKISLFSFFMSVYSIYLSRVNCSEEFILGTPVLNRANFKEKNTTGLYISTIPFKVNVDWNSSFIDLSQKISLDSISNFRHQKYPYLLLLEDIRKNDVKTPNLYNVLISYQNVRSNRNTSSINYSAEWFSPNDIPNDVQIHIHDMNNDGKLIVSYDFLVEKYTQKSIEDVHKRIEYIINQVIESPSDKLSKIEIVTPEEKKYLLDLNQKTRKYFYKDAPIHSFIEKQVDLCADKTAVICNGEKITYKELNEKANQLARKLVIEGVKPDTFVGIICNRSIELIISILAVLKSGAAYVPIDPEYPEERIHYMIENSETTIVLSKPQFKNLINKDVKYIDVSLSNQKVYTGDINNLPIIANGSNLAYMIYTSGSTGRPKGVRLMHKNINNFIMGTCQIIKFSKSKIIASVTTVCFDIFVLESLLPLQRGMTIVLANEEEQNDQVLLNKLCLENQVNIIQTTPSRMKKITADIEYCEYFKNITDLLVGGEPLPYTLLEYLKRISHRNNTKIYNMYGPTETAVWSTIKDLSNTKRITIGKPISNTSVYIMDSITKNLMPLGTPGCLFIGGEGVSKGYHDRDDLNKKVFINNPFNPKEIIYNTNDLAVLSSRDNDIIHLGRVDYQVKVRGYRIELGEIENRILSYKNIKECVIVAKNSNYLICYYSSKKDIVISDLISYLLNDLPNYMIPSYFVKLDKLPLTPNGKIDRKKLPVPNIDEKENIVVSTTDTEKMLEKNILKILDNGMKNVDITTPFISLGLDSLSIIQLQSHLLKYHLNLTTQTFYKYPTIKTLAEYIDGNSNVREETAFSLDEKFLHTDNEFEEIKNILKNENKTHNVNGIPTNNFKNVFLTGGNGFIGVHVLHELLKTTDCNVYCLVRGATPDFSIKRLNDSYSFYFKEDLTELINKRVFVINGDVVNSDLGLTKENHNLLINNVDTVIHTAAVVKHYGDFNEFKKINIDGTRNIVNFAYTNHFRFIHISSISVSGNYLLKQDNKDVDFSENNLYIGQHYTENVYVNSKFESENVVYNYMKKGLKGKVLRVGIVAGRSNDGIFQKNIEANAFYGRIKSLVNIAAISNDLLTQKVEFTPIDECAKAIVLLAKTTLLDNKIFHLYNHNLIEFGEIVKVLNEMNIPIKVIDTESFKKHILELSESFNNEVSAIVNDFNTNNLSLDYNFTVNIRSDYTIKFLRLLGFSWSKIDKNYLRIIIKYMKDVNFI
ncbi:MAG: amino acid adenylation domain-containing protein [Clostridia bacterium]|nr:amino acid adenylation domain-containing protein [Clostridia bacterium]